ncbi:hypothetical protein [Citricoccus sp. GCM10030269]|uniref:hypothetical protein n=1 Tax=Citricoccus sp. GCM10030269 TaxID=3273388 RepID=UPI003607D86C
MTGMAPDLEESGLEESTLDQLRAVVRAETTGERRALRDRFVTGRRKLFRMMAHRLCRTLGLPPALHRDDVEQLVALECLAWLDELVEDPAQIEGIVNWEGLLQVRARATVRAWADRNLSPASGMVALSRRIRLLNQLRDEMRAATGAEPSDRDLEREHNRRMAAARKDAAKQGMLVSSGEVNLARPAVDIFALELAVAAPESGLLHSTEGPSIVRAVVDRARRIGGITADVADCWLSGIYSSEGDQRVLTSGEVAAQLGLTQQSASAQIRKVRALAKRVLSEQLDIHHA